MALKAPKIETQTTVNHKYLNTLHMKLQKTHPKLTSSLVVQPARSLEIEPFLKALNSKKVADSPENEIEDVLSLAVSNAIFYLKHKPIPPDEYELTINAILLEVTQQFRGLTLNEILLACRFGSMRHYGDIMGVGVSQVVQWLSAFVADQRRHKAKKALLAVQENEQKESKEVTTDDFEKLALHAFDKYKKTGNYEDYGNIIYHFLERKGLINFCNKRKNEIKNIVLKSELERRAMPLNMDEKRKFDREKNEILNGMNDLKGKCKRHALKVFFSDLCEMGLELKMQMRACA